MELCFTTSFVTLQLVLVVFSLNTKQIIHIISFGPITSKSSANSFHELSMTSVSIDLIGEFWRATKRELVDIVWIDNWIFIVWKNIYSMMYYELEMWPMMHSAVKFRQYTNICHKWICEAKFHMCMISVNRYQHPYGPMGYRQHMHMGNNYPYNGYPAAKYPSPYQQLGYGSNPNMAYQEHYPGTSDLGQRYVEKMQSNITRNYDQILHPN